VEMEVLKALPELLGLIHRIHKDFHEILYEYFSLLFLLEITLKMSKKRKKENSLV